MDILAILADIFLYALCGILALVIVVKLLILLFEIIYALPEIIFTILFLLAFGIPIYLAFEINAWLILLLPFTLTLVAYLYAKWEDFAYKVRQEIKRRNKALSEKIINNQ